MLQWNTRLLALIVIVVLVAALVGGYASWEEVSLSW